MLESPNWYWKILTSSKSKFFVSLCHCWIEINWSNFYSMIHKHLFEIETQNQYTSTSHIYDLDLIDLWPWYVDGWLHSWPGAPIHDNINQLERKGQPNFKCSKSMYVFNIFHQPWEGGGGKKRIGIYFYIWNVFVLCARMSF